jgi:hypothetical protein
LQRAEAATSEAERDNILDELFLWFMEKFHELPQSFLTWLSARDIFWGVIVPLLLHLVLNRDAVTRKDLIGLEQHLRQDYAHLEQQRDERRLQVDRHLEEQISRTREEILQKLEAHRQTPNLCRHYISIKQVNLRESPISEARLIKKFAPNAVFEEIKEQGRWRHVEVFDYAKGEFRRGWIYKRNLQPLLGTPS